MIIRADARSLPLVDSCVDCVITSPPYWGLRDYGHGDQIGLESTPDAYVRSIVAVFAEVRRVLKGSGTVWVNLGDSYSGSGKGGNPDEGKQATNKGSQSIGVLYGKTGETARQAAVTNVTRRMCAEQGFAPKNLVGIPWRVAFALQADGWYLRSDIIWAKPNPMPESVQDRPTKSHEYLFLLSKQERYHYDSAAIAEPVSAAMLQQMDEGYEGLGLKDYEAAGVQNPSSVKARIIANAQRKNEQSGDRRKVGFNDRWDAKEREYQGKHAAASEQASGRRMLANVAEARAAGADHDSPFGPTRNKRTVWTIPTMPYAGAHFATMPEALVEPCVLAGCPMGGLVLDPFLGSGTVGAVCNRLGRRWVGTDLSYQPLAKKRTAQRGIRFDVAYLSGREGDRRRRMNDQITRYRSKKQGYEAWHCPDPKGRWMRVVDVQPVIDRLGKEIETQRMRAIVAEQHKVLSLLGKSSYQQVVEEQLRVQLAETQVALDQSEAELSALRARLAEMQGLLRDVAEAIDGEYWYGAENGVNARIDAVLSKGNG